MPICFTTNKISAINKQFYRFLQMLFINCLLIIILLIVIPIITQIKHLLNYFRTNRKYLFSLFLFFLDFKFILSSLFARKIKDKFLIMNTQHLLFFIFHGFLGYFCFFFATLIKHIFILFYNRFILLCTPSFILKFFFLF